MKTSKALRFVTDLTVILFALQYGAGCGYTRKSALPENMKTIFVETVKNKLDLGEVYSYVPGLEMTITNDVVKRLNLDGHLRVVQDPTKADVILKTDLIKFEQGGLRFTTLESVQEYRMFIVVSAQLVNSRNKEIIWTESNFSGESEYFVSDVSSTAREDAAQRAAESLAKNLVARIVEDW